VGGALGDVHRRSAVLPDGCDMHLRRERPPFFKRGTSTGGWQRGSLTPRMPPSLLLTAALTATRAAQSAARCIAPNPHIAKDIAESRARNHLDLVAQLTAEQYAREGEHCSGVCVPPSLH
jgi:hypothetical protein